MAKELLFSVTKKDFKIQFFCSGGPGGQHQNKTSSACRITHKDSGAIGESREHKEQLQNKKAAFNRLVNSGIFKAWHKLEVAKRMGRAVDVEKQVEDWMRPSNLKVEYIGTDENDVEIQKEGKK